MSSSRRVTSSVLLLLAMLATAGLTLALTPKLESQNGKGLDLEAVVPERFGNWALDRTVVPLVVSPDAQAQLEKIYSQTLSRTYVNSRGERIMLSIAYGADQSRALQVHKPEVCYAMQGFQIGAMVKEMLETTVARIPVMHLVAAKGSRTEPITYWIRVGDDIARGWYEQNLVKLKYGLAGKVPDGLLFRVSNISPNPSESYRIHEAFVSDLLKELSPQYRAMFVGSSNPESGADQKAEM